MATWGAPPPKVLTQYLLGEEYLASWKAPCLFTYNELRDPKDHVHAFATCMEDMIQCRDIWCCMFKCTLSGNAVGRYRELSLGSSLSYDDLQQAFLIAFSHQRWENTWFMHTTRGEATSVRVIARIPSSFHLGGIGGEQPPRPRRNHGPSEWSERLLIHEILDSKDSEDTSWSYGKSTKYIQEEDVVNRKEELQKKRRKEVDFRRGTPQMTPFSYGKMIETPQKEKSLNRTITKSERSLPSYACYHVQCQTHERRIYNNPEKQQEILRILWELWLHNSGVIEDIKTTWGAMSTPGNLQGRGTPHRGTQASSSEVKHKRTFGSYAEGEQQEERTSMRSGMLESVETQEKNA